MGTEGFQDRYINPYTDFGFKLLFGTAMNKELLISFLNALLLKREVIKDAFQYFSGNTGSENRLSISSLPGLANSMRTVNGAMALTVVPL